MDAPVHVLVVDGHEGVRTGLVQLLQRVPGVRAVGVASVPAAIARIGQGQPADAVFLDPRTAGGDAEESVRALSGSGPRVIVLTATLRAREAEALRRAGAAAVLLKGLPTPQLLRHIDAVAAGGSTAFAPGEAEEGIPCRKELSRDSPRTATGSSSARPGRTRSFIAPP